MPSKFIKPYEIAKSPLYRIGTKKDLARIISWKGSTHSLLSFSLKNNYQNFDLVMKSGKVREIENPKPALKRIQKRIEGLLKRLRYPDFLHSGIRGKSYLSNSDAHRHAKGATLTIDIEKFYPSIRCDRLVRLFIADFGCSRDVAELITNLICCNGHLATGSPASPLLSYLANKDVFEEIANRFIGNANSDGNAFTLYVDDMTITAPCIGMTDVDWIKKKLKKCGLSIKNNKIKLYHSGRPRLITGRVLRNGISRAPNKQHLKMRIALSAGRKKSMEFEKRSFLGTIKHIALLDDVRRLDLKALTKKN